MWTKSQYIIIVLCCVFTRCINHFGWNWRGWFLYWSDVEWWWAGYSAVLCERLPIELVILFHGQSDELFLIQDNPEILT